MIVIGLTGGVGAGKDVAAKIFKRFGAKIINADDVGHRILQKNPTVYRKLAGLFGKKILNPKNKIDRKKLGGIVFGNRLKLKLLNQVMHPLMEKEFRKKIAQERRKKTKIIMLNAAILFEAGWDKLVDKTILITAQKILRIKRLQKKGVDRKKAIAMVSSQWSDLRKKKKADFVIKNNGPFLELKTKGTVLFFTRGGTREARSDINKVARG